MKLLLNILTTTIITTNLTTCSLMNQTTFNNFHQSNLGVTNGTDVKVGDYPWYGTVKPKSAPDIQVGTGGGVLIAPNWFLTAAHVAVNYDSESPMKVVFGLYDTIHPTKIETRTSSKIILWENTGFLTQDIALVKLDKPITDIKPITIATTQQKPKPNEIAKVMGFGLIGADASDIPIYPTRLQEANIPIQDPTIAQNPKYKVKYYDENYDLLAGTITGKRINVALGDSGGPLVQKINGQWVVEGIVSHGEYDWVTPLPSVYGFVGVYHDWIINTMNNN